MGTFLGSVFACAEEQGKGLVELTYQGQPKAIVVIAENPTRPAHIAAKEFIQYIKKITGVELPLYVDGAVPKKEWSPRRVLIGESSLTREHGLKNADFQEQESLIETRGQDLILMGRDAEQYGIISYEQNGLWPTAAKTGALFLPMGTLYAVHSFLEQCCGVRWYLPGEIGEVCPKLDRLLISNVYRRTKPWTRYRASSRGAYRDPLHFYGYAQPDKLVAVPPRDMALWLLRMKIGGSPFACNHSFYSYAKRFGKEHPEWWKEGKPTATWPHPDYANPSLIQQATRDALDFFEGKFPKGTYPDGSGIMATDKYFAVMPLDGRKGLIWSEAGEKLRNNDPDMQEGFSCGWGSDFVFNLVNAVAQSVAAKHPDKWISCAAYGPYFNPPRRLKNFAPNVAVQQAGWLHRSFDPKEWEYQSQNLIAWSKIAKELYVWEYYLEQAQNQYRSFPVIFPRQIARTMRFFHDTGVVGMFFEASAAPGPDGWSDGCLANPAEDLLNHYVTWKYLCDDSADIEKALDEHYRLFYGPAEKPMKEFFTLIEQRWQTAPTLPEVEGRLTGDTQHDSWQVMCPPDVLQKLGGLIRAAMQMKLEEPHKTRVELMYKAIYEPMERHAREHHNRLSSRKRIALSVTATAPVIDGKLAEPAWAKAVQTDPFVSTFNVKPSVATTAGIMRDGENLYVAFVCDEPEMGKGGAAHTKADDPGILTDDHLEVLVDVERARRRYFQIAVNGAGVLADRAGGTNDWAWNAEAKVAVAKRSNGYDVELAIPLKSLGIKPIQQGVVWGINFGRVRSRLPTHSIEPAHTCWSPTFTTRNFDNPQEFGVMTMIPEIVAASGQLPQPIIHYDFEEIAKGAQIPDRAGDRKEGAPICSPAAMKRMKDGTPWAEKDLVEGIRGKGLQFGGGAAKQWLEVSLAPGINIATDDFTISFWFKTKTPSGILLGSTTSQPSWQLGFFRDEKKDANQTYPRLLASGGEGAGAAVYARDSATLDDDRWHHYVLMMDRGRLARIYVDGKLAGASDIRGVSGPLKNVLTIGGPYGYIQGVMDEFYLFVGSHDQALVDRLYQTAR